MLVKVYQATVYALLRLPGFLYQFFPAAGLLGGLLGLGLLASRSELTAMRAAGVSLGQIVYAVLLAALCLTIIVSLLGELIVPDLSEYAEQRKTLAVSSGQMMRASTGTWTRVGNSYLHIQTLLPNGIMQGIHRYEYDSHLLLKSTLYAKKAELIDGVWHLFHVRQTLFHPERVDSKSQEEMILPIHLNPDLLKRGIVEPDEMSLFKLQEYIHDLRLNHNETSQFELAFWKRIWQPLSICVMMMLAIPFVFGSQRNATMGLRLLIGIVMGFSFYILNQFFGPVSMVFRVPPEWAAALPTLLFAVFAVLLLRRVA